MAKKSEIDTPAWRRSPAVEEIAKRSQVERDAEILRLIASTIEDPGAAGETLSNLHQAVEAMRGWREKSLDAISANAERFDADAADFRQAIERAVGKGFIRHPIVRAWLANMRAFGEWDDLRRRRNQRHEVGVRRPRSPEILWLALAVEPMVKQGMKPSRIRLELMRTLRYGKVPEHLDFSRPAQMAFRQKLKKMSRQAFHAFLRRHGVTKPSK